MSNPALIDACLLVVDVQRQFVTPRTAHLPARIAAALPGYRFAVLSRLVPDEDSPVVRWKGFRAAPADAPESALALELPPGVDALVTLKTSFSALTAEARFWLAKRGVREVHLCGMDTDLCVTRTLHDVMEGGFAPALRADLCASSAGDELHRHGLAVARRLIGRARVLGADT